ncbi:MAG: hypothetical protein JSS30_06360 [Verrucomicrobia bacterium]|nr:hypothetical protein [Verrucomicrobiota bacterium]
MSAQNNNLAVTQPAFIGENGPALLISEKEKKKQQEELLKLAAALKAVESDVARSKSAAKEGKIVELTPADGSQDASNDEGTSSSAFIQAMTEMVLALQTLQVNISKWGEKKASYNSDISKVQLAVAQQNLEKAIKALNDLQNESWWQKLIEAFVAVFSAIAAIVTCNPELLLITALSILAMTGALSKITQGISDVLQDMGVPKDVADALSAAIVVVIVMIASLGTGEAAAAETVADTVATDVTEAAETAAEGAGTAASDSTSLLNRLGSGLKNLLSKISPKAVIALQAISGTGLVSNIAESIMLHASVSEEERKKIEQILSMIVAVIAVVASLGSSFGAVAQSTSDIAEQFGQNFVKFSRALFRVGGLVQAGGQAAEGGINISQGFLEKDLAVINANMTLIRNALEMNNTQTTEDQKHDADIIKQQNVGNRSLMDLMKGEAGFAQLFTQYAPV